MDAKKLAHLKTLSIQELNEIVFDGKLDPDQGEIEQLALNKRRVLLLEKLSDFAIENSELANLLIDVFGRFSQEGLCDFLETLSDLIAVKQKMKQYL